MTVVSAMRFNEQEGALVADEQSSSRMRKYDIAQKIHVFGNGENNGGNQPLFIIGGSGAADVLYDIITQAKNAFHQQEGQVTEGRVVAGLVAQIMAHVKRQYVDGILFNQFGIREAYFRTGQTTTPNGGLTPIDTSLMQFYHLLVKGEGEFEAALRNNFLALAHDATGINLYNISMFCENAVPVARPYETVGSGADMADGELYNFFETIPRKKRENIHPVDGIAALLHATERASVRNLGVGGTPLVALIKKNPAEEGKVTVVEPPEENTRLAGEIVKGTKAGLLPLEFQQAAVAALMYHNNPDSFETFEKEMFERAGEKRASLDRLLRGYKKE